MRATWLAAPAAGGGVSDDDELDDGDAAASFALALLLAANDEVVVNARTRRSRLRSRLARPLQSAQWAPPQLKPLIALLELPLAEVSHGVPMRGDLLL